MRSWVASGRGNVHRFGLRWTEVDGGTVTDVMDFAAAPVHNDNADLLGFVAPFTSWGQT